MTVNNDIALIDDPGAIIEQGGDVSDLAGLYDRPGFKIRRAHQTSVAVFANAEVGITTSQYGAMHVLAHIPDLDQITLARLVGLDRSTTSLVLGLLEQRGSLLRIVDGIDRRRRLLTLTEQGRQLYDKSQEPAKQAIAQLLAPVPQANRSRFLDLLERLVGVFAPAVEPEIAERLRGLYRRPGFLIRRAHQITSALFIEECREFDVTPTQFGMIFILSRRPDIDQITLARLGRFDRSTNAMVLRLLETRGLVERYTDSVDRRRRVLNLTQAGHDMLAAISTGTRRTRDRLLAPFSAKEQTLLLTTLDEIVGHFETGSLAHTIRVRHGLAISRHHLEIDTAGFDNCLTGQAERNQPEPTPK